MDRLTPEQRRKCMQANKSSGTKPEILLAKMLWHAGLRYRKNDRSVRGKPDLTFKKYKIAVFVDGEFWHGKNWALRQSDIKSNRSFWIAKIEATMQRDKEVTESLRQNGWQVFRFWGKDIMKNPAEYAAVIQQAVYEKEISD